MGSNVERYLNQIYGVQEKPTSRVDSLLNQIYTEDPYAEDEGETEPETFWKYLGNLGKYAKKLLTDNPYYDKNGMRGGGYGFLENLGKGMIQAGKNITSSTAPTIPRSFDELVYGPKPFRDKPIKDLTDDVWQNIKGTFSADGVSSLPKSLVEMSVEPLLETFSGTTRVGDTPVISTVQERAKAIQEVASLAAMGVGYNMTSKAMLNKFTPVGMKALAEPSVMRNLGQSALVAGGAGGLSGAMGTAISEAGGDDYASKIISSGLASIPLGIVMGVPFLEYNRVRQNVATARVKASEIVANELNDLTQHWSSVYGLASSENSTLNTLVNNIDSFAQSEKVVESILRSTVSGEQGWIVPNVNDVSLSNITKGISKTPADISPPLEWLDGAPRSIKISNPTFLGMKVEWGGLFDKAAYILSNPKSKAKSYNEIAESITKQFNVSLDDVIAHGKYVRQSIKNMIAGGKIERLTQPEFDAIERGLLKRGSEFIAKLPDGGEIRDYTGVTWKRVGNTLTDGNLVYPVNDNTVIKTLGRKSDSRIDPLSGKIKLPALDFRPDFQRAVGDFQLYKHKTANNTYDLLVSPVKLNKNHQTFYEQTGFLPGEVVVLDGQSTGRILQRGSKPNTFLVSGVKGVKGHRVYNQSRIQHHPDGIKNAVEGLQAFEATSENLFNSFFQSFRKDFNENLLRETGQLSFDNVFDKARIKSGIHESQRAGLKIATYRRLQDDFIDQLPDVERIPLQAIRASLEQQEAIILNDKSAQIHNYATSNNLYVRNKGAGSFEIRQAVDDKLIHTFNDFDDALTFLQKSGKNPYHSIDMDGNAPVPGSIADLGGLAEQWEGPVSNAWSRKMDRWQIGGLNLVTSSQELLHSFGAVFDDTFKTGNKFKNKTAQWVREGQLGAQALRNFGEQNYKGISVLYKKLDKVMKGMSKDQKEDILGYIEALSPDEVRTKLLNREANPIEIKKAIEWSEAANKGNFSMFDVEDLFHAAEKVGGKAGTQEFEAAINNYVKNGIEKNGTVRKLDPNVAKIVIDLGKLTTSNMVGQLPFSKYLTLKLADGYQFPANSLNRTQFFAKKKMTPQQKTAAELFEDIINQITDLAEIPKDQRINFHAPSIRMIGELNSWAETALPSDLMTGLKNAIVGDNRTMIRDPLSLVYKYLEEVGRHKTMIEVDGNTYTYNQLMNKLRNDVDVIANEIGALEGPASNAKHGAQAFQKKALGHLDELQGKGDASQHTRSFLKSFYKGIGMPEKASSDMATNIIAASTQGGNQMMWIRDVVSAGGISYSLFGHEFARKAIFTPVSEPVISMLEKRGKIPIVGASDMASPTSTRMTGDINTKISNMADVALTLSGQHHIYRHRLAGIYLATEDLINKNIPKLQRREISKKTFYDNINIDIHPRAVQTLFDKYISSGDIQAGIDYLSQQNTKRIMNLFGYANTPVGWTTSAGKLLGQYGSWTSNHIATALNSTRNIVSANGAKRMLRLASYEGAVWLTGRAAGLNLAGFSFAPWNTVPGVGPIADIADEAQRIGRVLGGQGVGEAVRQTSNLLPGVNITPDWEMQLNTDFGRLFVPYSYATENVLKGLIDLPNEGYSPIMSMMKMVGFKPLPPE